MITPERLQEIKHRVHDETMAEFEAHEDIWEVVNELITALEEMTKSKPPYNPFSPEGIGKNFNENR